MSEKKTTSVKITEATKLGGERVAPGEVINDMPIHEARRLVHSRKAEFFKIDEADSLQAKIMAAIENLPEDGFGQDGKPKVKAIENLLGQDISAADRDAAWDAMEDPDE